MSTIEVLSCVKIGLHLNELIIANGAILSHDQVFVNTYSVSNTEIKYFFYHYFKMLTSCSKCHVAILFINTMTECHSTLLLKDFLCRPGENA